MLPYLELKPLQIGSISVHWFGVLVDAGIITGRALACEQARPRGRQARELRLLELLLTAFFASHVFDMIFYHPAEVLRRPFA